MLLPAVVQIVFWLYQAADRQRWWYGGALIAIYLTLLVVKAQGVGDFLYVWVPLSVGSVYALAFKRYALVDQHGVRLAQTHSAQEQE